MSICDWIKRIDFFLFHKVILTLAVNRYLTLAVSSSVGELTTDHFFITFLINVKKH